MLKDSHLPQVVQAVMVISKFLSNRCMSARLHDLKFCVRGVYRRCIDRPPFLGGACDLSKVPRRRRLQRTHRVRRGSKSDDVVVQGDFQQNQHKPGQDTPTQDSVSEARGGWPTLRALTLFQILWLCKSRPSGMMAISNSCSIIDWISSRSSVGPLRMAWDVGALALYIFFSVFIIIQSRRSMQEKWLCRIRGG